MKNLVMFYDQPYKKNKYSGWVYDGKNRFCFQFNQVFNGNDEDPVWFKLQQDIIDSLNSVELSPLELDSIIIEDGDIIINDYALITIRGWGNLTGTGAYNFSGEKASKIQDDFQKWIVYRLTGDKKLLEDV